MSDQQQGKLLAEKWIPGRAARGNRHAAGTLNEGRSTDPIVTSPPIVRPCTQFTCNLHLTIVLVKLGNWRGSMGKMTRIATALLLGSSLSVVPIVSHAQGKQQNEPRQNLIREVRHQLRSEEH